ncbi:hypothetical protein SAMN02745116_01390 [Pilibacter termitis]|uniref:Uncharacterized protein n=1 Tax=Pilibacter termitis TaxID=263852 RepID=A0A1T4NDD0_9ENTE|nr:hypothetical protein [Pilibacter termitis]SJZ77270.1 hypothetical protein SAMN02745116_01390 [Pilibacter termitis]
MLVWKRYGKYEVSYLRKMNHQLGGAGQKNYREGVPNTTIPNEDI